MAKCTLLAFAIVVAVQVNAVTIEEETGKSNKVTTLEDMMAISPIRRSRRSIAPMSAAEQGTILDLHNSLRRQEHGSDMDYMVSRNNIYERRTTVICMHVLQCIHTFQ